MVVSAVDLMAMSDSADSGRMQCRGRGSGMNDTAGDRTNAANRDGLHRSTNRQRSRCVSDVKVVSVSLAMVVFTVAF